MSKQRNITLWCKEMKKYKKMQASAAYKKKFFLIKNKKDRYLVEKSNNFCWVCANHI